MHQIGTGSLINEINHRCLKISWQVLQTCRHRPMVIGAFLADYTSYFLFSRHVSFLVKSIVLCTDKLNQ